jgi:hypothetical protein
MIFLSSGASIWRSIQRASGKALEHPEGQSHNDELDAYFLALGWVLVAIGIYFLYQWLFSSPREEIAGAERQLPARSESRGPAIVLLFLGALSVLIGTGDNPRVKESLPVADGARLQPPETTTLRHLDGPSVILSSNDDAYLLRRPTYPFPMLAKTPYEVIWPNRIEMPKVAHVTPAGGSGASESTDGTDARNAKGK